MAAGDRIYWTDVDEAIEPPCGRLVQTVAQTGVANNTSTALTFTTEDLDTHNFHSTSVNTSRVTPTVAGWYMVRGGGSFTGQTDFTGIEIFIRKNGSSGIPPATRLPHQGTTASTAVIQCSALVECNGTTDYFEACFRLNRSGAGNGSTVISSQFASTLEWIYVRPL